MRKLMVAASTAAFLAMSSLGALAEEAKGTISSIDASAGTVTLDSGDTFKLPTSVDAASLKVGDQVTIEYQQGDNGQMTATSVQTSQM
jgi:Cu/Ag efflux protein CusF